MKKDNSNSPCLIALVVEVRTELIRIECLAYHLARRKPLVNEASIIIDRAALKTTQLVRF